LQSIFKANACFLRIFLEKKRIVWRIFLGGAGAAKKNSE